jgi:hypothetical protein
VGRGLIEPDPDDLEQRLFREKFEAQLEEAGLVADE